MRELSFGAKVPVYDKDGTVITEVTPQTSSITVSKKFFKGNPAQKTTRFGKMGWAETTDKETLRRMGIIRSNAMRTGALKRITTTAAGDQQEAYDRAAKEVKQRITKLGDLIRQHQKEQKKGAGNYGFVGDLQHVRETLDEVIGFLTNTAKSTSWPS